MKILSVTLNNINALKGRWFIDFDHPPLKNAGIFVICGPTGAGKTSVLDAITLSLYGETDRLHKKDIENIMTRHTGDCYCETIFQLKNKKFKSHWSLRRSRGKADGKVQPPKRLLYDLSGNEPVVIAQKINNVQAKIESITGLDYKRFSRSMMLAQGRFAEFLNAPDKERASLLEKITGTDIYSKLSIKAFEKARQEKENLNLLQKEQHSISKISPEEIQKLNEELKTIKENSTHKKSIIYDLQQKIELRKRIKRLEDEKISVEKKLINARNQEKDLQTDNSRLERSNLALEFKSDLDGVTLQKSRLNDLENDNKNLDEQLKNNQKLLQDIEAKQVIVKKQFDDAIKIQKETEPLIQETIIIDRDLLQLQSQIKNKQKDLNQKKTRCSRLEILKKETQDNHKKMLIKLKELKNWLEANEHDENLSEHISYIHSDLIEIHETRNQYSEYQKKITKQRKELSDFESKQQKQKKSLEKIHKQMDSLVKEINNENNKLKKQLGGQNLSDIENNMNETLQQSYIFENIIKVSSQYKELKKNIVQDREDLKNNSISKLNCNKLLKTINKKIDNEKNTLKALDQAVQHEMLFASFSEKRKNLKHDSPCPLCGSLQHPYVSEKKVSQETQIQKERDKKKKDVEKLYSKKEFQKTEHMRFKSIISNNIKNILQYKQNLMQLNKEWDYLCNEVNTPLNISNNDELNKQSQDIKKRLIIFQQRYKTSKFLIDKKNRLEKNFQEQKEKDFTFQNELKELEFKIQRINSKIKDLTNNCDDIQEKGKKISQDAKLKLSKYKLNVPKFGKENDLIDLLKKRALKFKDKVQSGKDLDTKIQAIIQKINENDIEMKSIVKQIDELSEQLQSLVSSQKEIQEKRYKLLKDKNPENEKIRLIEEIEKYQDLVNKYAGQYSKHEKALTAQEALKKNKQNEIVILQNTYKNNMQYLLESIKPKGFSKIEDLQAAIIDSSEAQDIKKRFEKAQKMIHQEETRYKDIFKSLEIEKEKTTFNESLEEIETNLNKHEKEKESIDRRVGSIEQIINEEKKQNILREEAQKKLQKQEIISKRWNDLNYLIGSHDGNSFRTFAQGLTLNRLIEYSNVHLKKLSDRYLLKRLSSKSLTLNIMDTYQANSLRPTNTLSGGESFLVSLAMALGLSDLAGNSIRVESLFLDEGFGSLDEETLVVAINAIERLNHRGKMIGVISHIESLKERIPVHIEVSKIAGGTSRLDIINDGI